MTLFYNKESRYCPICKKEIPSRTVHERRSTFCSRTCQGVFFQTSLKGSNNPHWLGGKIVKSCFICLKDFSVIRAKVDSSKYCSRQCLYKSNSIYHQRRRITSGMIREKRKLNFLIIPKREKKKYFCNICKKTEVLRKTKYCNICRINKGFTFVNCLICGFQFKKRNCVVLRSNNNFCSNKCYYRNVSIRQKGSKSWFWEGGITNLVMQIRNCFKYKEWRDNIFTKDNFTCLFCKVKGGRLNTDHYPKSFSSIFHSNNIKTLQDALNCEEFWDVNNGRTLCKECHRKTDSFGARAKEQWQNKVLHISPP